MDCAQGILKRRRMIVCVVSFLIDICSCGLLCSPAQEGIEYVIKQETLQCDTANEFAWEFVYKKETNQTALICSQIQTSDGPSWNCQYDEVFGGKDRKKLTIPHVSRTPFDLETYYIWKCRNAVPTSLSCFLEVYAKPTSPNCTASFSADEMILLCSTSKVYPEAKCIFTAQGKTDITIGPVTGIDYKTIPVASSSPVYYSTTCKTTIPLERLTAGPFSFETNMYPDVTNGDNYGTRVAKNTSITLSYPSASLDPNCFQYVKREDPAVCTCRRTNPGTPAGSVQWFEKNSINPIATGSGPDANRLKVFFDAPGKKPEYVCKGKSALGSASTGESFIPKFAYGPEQDSFTIHSNSSGAIDICPGKIPYVTVTCELPVSTVEPYPKFSASLEESSLENKVNGSKDGDNYAYSKTLTLTDGAKNTVWCAAENGQFPIYNTHKKSLLLQLREPPRSAPVFKIGEMTYKDNSNATVNGDVNSTLTIACEVDGGYPPVDNVTLKCGLHVSSDADSRVSMDITVSEDTPGLDCFCTALHVTGCYHNNNAVVMLEFTFLQHESSGSEGGNTAAIAGGVAGGILFLAGVIVVVVIAHRKGLPDKCRNKGQRLTYGHGSPAADDEITHVNDLYGTTAQQASNGSPYEDFKSDNGSNLYSNNAANPTKGESDVYENTKSQEANKKKGEELGDGRYISEGGLLYTTVALAAPSSSSANKGRSMRPRIVEEGVQYTTVEFKK